jgi:hypothetical protein
MAQHSHRFTIADDDAVRVLLAKLVKGGANKLGAINCSARLTMRLATTKTRIKKCGRRSSMGC